MRSNEQSYVCNVSGRTISKRFYNLSGKFLERFLFCWGEKRGRMISIKCELYEVEIRRKERKPWKKCNKGGGL